MCAYRILWVDQLSNVDVVELKVQYLPPKCGRVEL